MTDMIAAARDILANAQNLVAFTGAGMSADSGLDTYRDAQTGVWENVDPHAMASIDAWARDPEPMWRWYLHRKSLSENAQPNPGHRALAELGAKIITQNIDDLHERGGSTDVVHLHGSLFEFRCTICSRPWKGATKPQHIPECPLCGNLIRPSVVWFGEALPPREWDAAENLMSTTDALIIVGTSGVVQPAAGLPRLAATRGVPVLEITPQPTALTPLATVQFTGRAGEVLPLLT